MENANDFLEMAKSLRRAANLGRDFLFLLTDLREIHIEDPSRQLVKALGITLEGVTTISRKYDQGTYPWEHYFFLLNIRFYWISKSQNPFPEEEVQDD